MNRVSGWLGILLVLLLMVVLTDTAGADIGGGESPEPDPDLTQVVPPEGETRLALADGSVFGSVDIPENSGFWASGAGSSGSGKSDPVPCQYWGKPYVEPVLGDFGETKNPGKWLAKAHEKWEAAGDTLLDSPRWRFTEVLSGGEDQATLSQLRTKEVRQSVVQTITKAVVSVVSGAPVSKKQMSELHMSAVRDRVLGLTAPLAEATRRFTVECEGPDGEYETRDLGTVDIPVDDPFWSPYDRLNVLWGMVDVPTFDVKAPVEVDTWGGLVVNLPAWFQVDSSAWRPYYSPTDTYRGWTSQIVLIPEQLTFEIAGDQEHASVPCTPGTLEEDRPDDLPDYWEDGQLYDQYSCVWVPHRTGEATVRARVTYSAMLSVNGYTAELEFHEEISDPLTLDVGEIRVVNVPPDQKTGTG